jgi:hypothetical protein
MALVVGNGVAQLRKATTSAFKAATSIRRAPSRVAVTNEITPYRTRNSICHSQNLASRRLPLVPSTFEFGHLSTAEAARSFGSGAPPWKLSCGRFEMEVAPGPAPTR